MQDHFTPENIHAVADVAWAFAASVIAVVLSRTLIKLASIGATALMGRASAKSDAIAAVMRNLEGEN